MKSAMMEPTLYQVLEELVPDLLDTHEIMAGLDREWVNSWRSFVYLEEDDIPAMEKFLADGITLVPLSSNAIRFIYNLNQMIWKNVDDGIPGAKLASTYAPKALERRCCEINRINRAKAEKIRQRNAEDERIAEDDESETILCNQARVEDERRAQAIGIKQRHAEDERRCFEAERNRRNQAKAKEKKSMNDRGLSEMRRLLKLRRKSWNREDFGITAFALRRILQSYETAKIEY